MSKDKEILIIQNFGPIKDIKLDLKKFNVLIGKQATGKSTVAKVLAVCRYFSYIVDYHPLERGSVGRIEGAFYKGLVEWGIGNYKKNETFIFYENKDYSIEISSKNENINIGLDNNENYIFESVPVLYDILTPKSEKFKNLLKELKEIKPKNDNPHFNVIDSDWQPSENFFRLNVKKVMNNPFYLPTERGLQSIFSLGKSPNYSDSLFNQLASLYNISKSFKNETKIEPLGIYYKNENGKGLTRKNKESSYYKLSNGASGYQSTIPIVLTVKHYNENEKRNRTFIVEEPEQNLFPTAQKKLIEFLIETVNEHKNQFLIPTHSPYILTTLSNLIYAHKIGTSEKGKYEDKVNDIISKKSWVDVKDIAVYYLNDGIAENMVNEEECTINLDNLDNVSEIINNEFDKLLTIETQND